MLIELVHDIIGEVSQFVDCSQVGVYHLILIIANKDIKTVIVVNSVAKQLTKL